MDSTSFLVFSLINVLILGILLYRIVGPTLTHFFFVRHTTIRKQMLSSVMTLRQARAFAARMKERYEELPADIESRRRAISESCEKECAGILQEAREKAEHMLRVGERRAAEERRRHAALLRERLMRSAFSLAEEKLRKRGGPAMQRHYVQRGVEELDCGEASEEVARR